MNLCLSQNAVYYRKNPFTTMSKGQTVYVDSHCHLDFPCFDADRDSIIANCITKGIDSLMMPGVEPDQWPKLTQLSKKHPGLYYTVGIHPWWIERNRVALSPKGLNTLEAAILSYTQDEHCIGIGECGLDATVRTPIDAQLPIFEWQLSLAQKTGLPAVIHCVKSHNQMLSSLDKFKGISGVMHAFTGSTELALQYWRRGFYLGAGGSLTYERAKKTRKAFAQLPLKSILLETDAPDMPLEGKQGQRNSPENLPLVAQCVAQLGQYSLDQVAQASKANFHSLFHI